MRHKSAQTTLDQYVHYDDQDLIAGMKAADRIWREDEESN